MFSISQPKMQLQCFQINLLAENNFFLTFLLNVCPIFHREIWYLWICTNKSAIYENTDWKFEPVFPWFERNDIKRILHSCCWRRNFQLSFISAELKFLVSQQSGLPFPLHALNFIRIGCFCNYLAIFLTFSI